MDWIEQTWEWIRERETLFTWVGSLSLLTLIVSAIFVPIFIRRMPSDYFLESDIKTEEYRQQHPGLRILFHLLKNLVGGILLLGGILMIVTPGQGVLTMMIGLMLMDFPGKRTLEIRLVSLKPINKAINWIRAKADKPPLELPESPHPQES